MIRYIPVATNHFHHVLNDVDRRIYSDRAEHIFLFRARPSIFGWPQKASTEYYETQRRYNYVTPKSYLELIGFYKFLLDQKRTEVQRQIDRLDVGLSTLRKTAADVAELQVDLTHTMVKVQQESSAIRFGLHPCVFFSVFSQGRRRSVVS